MLETTLVYKQLAESDKKQLLYHMLRNNESRKNMAKL